MATVITPNIPEAEALLGHPGIKDVEAQKDAALMFSSRFGSSCVLKGGHMAGDKEMVDVLASDGKLTVFTGPRIDIGDTHGTGCTFASACAAHLARGESLCDAVKGAKEYVAAALRNALPAGKYRPLGIG